MKLVNLLAFTLLSLCAVCTAESSIIGLIPLAQSTVAPASPPTAPATDAEPVTPREALQRLFASETLEESWFNAEFLAQVPISQVEEIVAQLRDQLGGFEAIEGDASPFTVRFAGGTVTAQIVLDAEGRIYGLRFDAVTPATASSEEAVARIGELPGDVAVLMLRNGEDSVARNADEPLAVGSAFKLAVLAALQAQIDAGEHRWDEVVSLDPAWKSLPGGILQDWPDASPLTLHSLATLMISISDNTAADALIHIVGRDAVEAYAPRLQPFLTTQEAFKLKATTNASLHSDYLNGDTAAKRQVLDKLGDLPLPTGDDLPPQPTLEIERHLTTRELCALMAQVEDLDLTTVSPGLADPAAWERIAFKGGSELGVLDLTTWLESDDATYCVSVTQNRNDAGIDQEQFNSLYRALLATLP